MLVGPLLRAWRTRALLTQEQLAERAGLSVRTIRRPESDEPTGRPHSTSLQMLAASLNLTVADRATLAAAAGRPGRTGGTEDPPASGERPLPRQLPSNVHGFVGRDEDIAQLDKIMGLDGTAGDTARAAVFIELDRLDEALSCARRAVDVLRDNLEPFRSVTGLITLAVVHAARGERDAAPRCYREAISAAEGLGSTYEVIHLGIRLGHQLSAAGAADEAIEVWREAHRICLEHDDPAAAEIERLLRS